MLNAIESVADSSEPAVLVFNSSGVVLDLNPRAAQFLGISDQTFQGRSMAEFFSPAALEKIQNTPSGVQTLLELQVDEEQSLLVPFHCSVLAGGTSVLELYHSLSRDPLASPLRDTLAWFQMIVEQVPGVLWTANTDLQYTSGVSLTLKKQLLEDADVYAHNANRLNNLPADCIEVQAHRRALNGETVVYEVQWKQRDLVACVKPLLSSDQTVIGVIGIAQDITLRKQAEQALQEAKADLENQVKLRTEELIRTNQNLEQEIAQHKKTAHSLGLESKKLLQQLEHQEEHRKMLSYEIHDGLVQYMAGALMQLESLTVTPEGKKFAEQRNFGIAIDLMRKAVGEARRLISGLRPPILDEAGLSVALEYLANETRQAGVIQVETLLCKLSAPLANALETAIFRIAQEALTNIRRHSQSAKARLQLTEPGDGTIVLVVEDFGVGFEVDQLLSQGLGLQGIRDRARLLNGEFKLESSPGQGTRLEIVFPILLKS